MSARLIGLRDVPDEEAAEIRALLDGHRIDYFETPPGNWGISAGAIWIQDPEALPLARELLQDFQTGYAARARDANRRNRLLGRTERVADRFRRQPLRGFLYLAAILMVLYLSTVPFLRMAG